MPHHHREVVCPFCSIACDDLEVEAAGDELRVVAGGCPISVPAFARRLGAGGPVVDGVAATLDVAVARAAGLLRASRLPLLAGLGTDTAGARAAVALAEAAGGVLDHAASAGLFANLRAMQDGGWVATTLAEARNRADLLLFVGTNTAAATPRLLERLLRPGPRLVDLPERPLVFLGAEPPEGVSAKYLPCAADTLPGVVGLLHGMVEGRAPPVAAPGDEDDDPEVPLVALGALADQLRAARYALVVWVAGELPGPHADLLVGRLAGLLRALNLVTRAAGLPLAGPDNVGGVNQVCAWQTGVPLRTSLVAGVPDHDPWRFAAGGLLERGEVDCLVWVSSFRDLDPPAVAVPTIALARCGHLPERPVGVLIPVGTPGLDHAGSFNRTDAVVTLPLRALRDTGLPTAAAVLDAIRRELVSPVVPRPEA
jgi:formylmethanofuran dehydrogenase subunit B